jgi:tRNA (mo5U34)-methyltransferase
MGILYHHRSPLEILRSLFRTLRVGGRAIIESQTIDEGGSMALFPEHRYAKARNVFFVPTRDCLINWVARSGFKNVELVSHTKVTPHEQRSTELMAYESLADFLDPNDENLTVEGYPAPYRTVVRAERRYV